MKKDPNRYPKGWNRKIVEDVIRRAETQSDDDAIAEADAAWENQHMVLMTVPTELASQVRALIANHKSTRRSPIKSKKPSESKRGSRAA